MNNQLNCRTATGALIDKLEDADNRVHMASSILAVLQDSESCDQVAQECIAVVVAVLIDAKEKMRTLDAALRPHLAARPLPPAAKTEQ